MIVFFIISPDRKVVALTWVAAWPGAKRTVTTKTDVVNDDAGLPAACKCVH